MDDDAEKPKRPPSKRQPKLPSKYADASYEVGKGKPPVETRFKPGNKGGGRKPGVPNQREHEKLLNTRIIFGRDGLGRPTRRTFRNVIDRQLLTKAAQGDLAAINIEKDFELKDGGDAAEQRASAANSRGDPQEAGGRKGRQDAFWKACSYFGNGGKPPPMRRPLQRRR